MIVEGLLTTVDSAGNLNVAPMGPIVDGDFAALTLRPFRGSTTYENLLATKVAVFHIVDSVDLIAEAAIRKLSRNRIPPTKPAAKIAGFVLEDCCRYFELQVTECDISEARSSMTAKVVLQQERRPHFGFNRARHAVIEAATLATRVHILPKSEIESAIQFLKPAVEKTGGPVETGAFQMLVTYIEEHFAKGART